MRREGGQARTEDALELAEPVWSFDGLGPDEAQVAFAPPIAIAERAAGDERRLGEMFAELVADVNELLPPRPASDFPRPV